MMKDLDWICRLKDASKLMVNQSLADIRKKKIWKDECAFSFCTPESTSSSHDGGSDGLFVNLSTLQTFSNGYVLLRVLVFAWSVS